MYSARPQIATSPLTESRGAPRVLVVDTPRMAQLIQRMLAGRFDVVCAHDAVAGLAAIKHGKVDVVVAELTVRGGGLRFFELLDMRVEARHIPFLLMCVRPSADLVERLQRVGVDGVLVKPFAPSVLIERVGGALQKAVYAAEETDEKIGVADLIRARMKSIDGLPAFPSTHAEMMRLANSRDADHDDVADQIRMAPDVLATVLKLANSPSYGIRRKVDSLKLAVTLLGLKELANLVMSLQIFRQLGSYSCSTRFDAMEFWKHSVGTAFIARAIGQKMQAEVDLCFPAGLLHDAGKMVLDRFFPEFFEEALRQIQERRIPAHFVEQELMGLAHSHVGGYLAVSWGFADALTEAIVCHHDPSNARHHIRLSSIVHVANAVAYHLGYGSSGEAVHQAPDDEALVRAMWKLGMGPNALERLVDLGRTQLEPADEFLSVLAGA